MNNLVIENVNYTLDNVEILKNLSFRCNAGEVVAIIGENGVGKTTLLKFILENINKSKSVQLNSENKNIGYVSQFRQLEEEVPLSVYDFISLPLTKKIVPWLTKNEKEQIKKATKLTNINTYLDKKVSVLSGGERQRVYLTQALVNNPALLLLDEFTSNLDKKSEVECIKLVKSVTKKANIITLCVTHELSLITDEYIDKILYLSKDGYKFINIEDYDKEKDVLKFCRHYVGE